MAAARTPDIVAHRGLHDRHPENGLTAFRAAWSAGFEWCECDVHLAADGTPIVIHDETLDRTTTGTGLVRSATADAINSMQLRLTDGRPNGEPVPTLWRLLSHMPLTARLLVEVKAPGREAAERVVRAIWAGNAERRCVIQSFAEEHVRAVAELEPPLPVAWLIDQPEQLVEAYRCPWPRINVRHDLLDEATIRPLRHESKSVGVWTVNDEPDIRRVLELGVDTIITDNPRLVRVMADRSSPS